VWYIKKDSHDYFMYSLYVPDSITNFNLSPETISHEHTLVNNNLLTACHVQNHGTSSSCKQQMPQCRVASD